MTRTRIITSRIKPFSFAQSLNEYCANRFTYLSADQWRGEITNGKVTLDGAVVTDPATILHGEETLAWDGSSIVEPEVDDRIAILYEDDWFVAVNKTGNLPVHPSGRYFNNTLVALLSERLGQKVYPVHRLDRETSGIIILAFDGRRAGMLSEALSCGSKEYLALVHGNFPEEELVIDLPLGRDTASDVAKKRRAWPGGNEKALTRFKKVLQAVDIALVRCFPQTGRLHQIRAHLLAAGYPIVGDKLYGRDKTAFLKFIREGMTAELQNSLLLPRSALHAARLVFRHPQTGKELILRAPLPKMFVDFIRALKAQKVDQAVLKPNTN